MTTALPYVYEPPASPVLAPFVPTTEKRAGEFMTQETAVHSIAISLKRIADALDVLCDVVRNK